MKSGLAPISVAGSTSTPTSTSMWRIALRQLVKPCFVIRIAMETKVKPCFCLVLLRNRCNTHVFSRIAMETSVKLKCFTHCYGSHSKTNAFKRIDMGSTYTFTSTPTSTSTSLEDNVKPMFLFTYCHENLNKT